MADIFSTMQVKIYAAISGGTGTGSTDPGVLSRYIPASRFLPTMRDAPVDDEALDLNNLDRRFWFRWNGGRRISLNSLDNAQERNARFTLTNCNVQGDGSEDFLLLWPGETAAQALNFPGNRAMNDSEMLAQCLEFPGIMQDPQNADPRIIGIDRDADSVVIPSAGGVILTEQVYALRYRYLASNAHAPG